MRRARRTLAALLVGLAIALPVLNPLTPGPSPNVFPLLVGGVGVAALLCVFEAQHARVVILAWLAAAVVSSAIGLLQYFGLAEPLAPWASAAAPGEAYGNLRQRNQLATLTNMGLASLLWCLQHGWPGKEHKQWLRTLPFFAALAVLTIGNAATASRVGFVQLLVLVGLAAWWQVSAQRRMLALGVSAIPLYVIAAFALPWGLEQLHGIARENVFFRLGQAEGCSSRLVLWQNVLQLIAQAPWTGWGLGELDYAHYANLYEGERFCDILDNAHNFPLHLAVELGLPAALLAVTGIGWFVYRCAPWRAKDPLHQLAWTVLVLLGLHSMVEYPLWYAPFHMAAALCVLFVVTDQGAKEAATRSDWTAGVHPGRIAGGLVLAAAMALAWDDYRRVSQAYLPYEERDPGTRDAPARASPSWSPFRSQELFAKVTTTSLTRANAQQMALDAARLLHYSPEPRVIEILIESLLLTGDETAARWHMARYRAAFPASYAAWIKARGAEAPSGN